MSYQLFQVYGIELEYMLVHSGTLRINPVVDKLFTKKHGSLTGDVENGKIEWSNELVAHVMELKTNGPTDDLETLDEIFTQNIKEVNALLEELDSELLPTAAHPLMHPGTEMQLWQHNYSNIYALYNRIFDCRSHGWSNVQSMHLNLPFSGDAQFEKLHAAVRILLPIIPALSASSPFFEGKFTGYKDTRMEVYKTNQKEIPQMTGKVIPEQLFSRKDYFSEIFEPINKAIEPFDTDHILDHHFLNSRGAIARFDRSAIEIRVIDIQECPKADLGIAVLIIEALKLLVSEELISLGDQKEWHENALFEVFDQVIVNAEEAVIADAKFAAIFDLQPGTTAKQVWEKIYVLVKENISLKHQNTIEFLLKYGSLSTRILNTLGEAPTEQQIIEVYRELGKCLKNNMLFEGSSTFHELHKA